jgi:Tfp pilus assembly protein PilV
MRRPAPATRPSRSRRRPRPTRARPARALAGFTLIEVAILIVIAGIAVLPLAMLFATTSIRSSDARSASVAAHLAETKLEEITADRRAATRGYAYIQGANYPSENPVPAFSSFSRSVTVAPDSIFDGVTYRTVSVTVTTSGIPPVTLTTWFTNY